ncbi:MAG: Gfo/Idh/MocA family oxidoreductase [Campylobacterales bacterium]|nr:Gfo/Idh/MocA family oxidoreductase [Campylobacterales bacterium]
MNKKIKLKIAFLGGGINSAVGRTHYIAINMDNRYELVSGCFSRNSEINIATAEEYNVSLDRVYANLDELITNEKEKIDAICILTPTPNHKNEVIKCVENNIAVICEKALAVSSEEGLEIKKTLEQFNGFLAVTYNYTGYPMVRELRRMIRENHFGKIEQIHIEMPQEGFSRLDKHNNPQRPQEWRLHDGNLPTISLDLGVHLHHLIDFLTGEKPIELSAVHNHFGSFKEIIDNIICIANYTKGISCNIWYSKAALGYRNGLRIRLYGETGSAEWFQMDPEILQINDNKGHRQMIDRATIEVRLPSELRYNRFKSGHPAGYIEAFANHYCDIADALSAYKHNKETLFNEYVFGITQALEGLVTLEAITEAAKTKSWVSTQMIKE